MTHADASKVNKNSNSSNHNNDKPRDLAEPTVRSYLRPGLLKLRLHERGELHHRLGLLLVEPSRRRERLQQKKAEPTFRQMGGSGGGVGGGEGEKGRNAE